MDGLDELKGWPQKAQKAQKEVDEVDGVDEVKKAGDWKLGEVRNRMIKLPCSRCGRPNIGFAEPEWWPMEHINCFEHSFRESPIEWGVDKGAGIG